MADESWKIGDLVVLKSGGPTMTVTSAPSVDYAADADIRCAWFDPGTKTTARTSRTSPQAR